MELLQVMYPLTRPLAPGPGEDEALLRYAIDNGYQYGLAQADALRRLVANEGLSLRDLRLLANDQENGR